MNSGVKQMTFILNMYIFTDVELIICKSIPYTNNELISILYDARHKKN